MAELKREQGAEKLIANIGYADGVEVINNFDSKEPWTKIRRIEEADGNVWIYIPKFYTKYVTDENGYIKERYISIFKAGDDYHLNPIFIDENGKELSSIQISAYLGAVEDGVMTSRSGIKPTSKLSKELAQQAVDKYNTPGSQYDYGLYNIWASILEQDLFTVEFAESDISKILQGYKYSNYAYPKGFIENGNTDNIAYCTGTRSEYTINGGAPMKYRGIENMVGNGCLVLDDIKILNNKIYIRSWGQDFQDTGIDVSQTSGNIKTLKFDPTTKLVFPGELTEDDSSYGSRYTVDSSTLGSNKTYKIVRGVLNDSNNGLFSTVLVGENFNSQYYVYRMIRKPRS